MGIEFGVSQVSIGEVGMKEGQACNLFNDCEAGSHVFEEDNENFYIQSTGSLNGFVAAAHHAFNRHYPLVIKPDHIWILITQGLAIHINQNSEKLKGIFNISSDPSGDKKTLTVIDDSLIKKVSSKELSQFEKSNNWSAVFDGFDHLIASQVGEEKARIFRCNFSTTTKNEIIASQIVLMDAFKSYFNYVLLTRCGIPTIRLEGSREDWVSIKKRTESLDSNLEIDWWRAEMIPILDRFIQAFDLSEEQRKSKDFLLFWTSFYKVSDRSGGPYVSGWINAFFPYLQRKELVKRNEFVSEKQREKRMSDHFGSGPNIGDFPLGVSKVPMVWDYLGKPFDMTLMAGFFNPKQNKHNLAITPVVGWAMLEKHHLIERQKSEWE